MMNIVVNRQVLNTQSGSFVQAPLGGRQQRKLRIQPKRKAGAPRQAASV